MLKVQLAIKERRKKDERGWKERDRERETDKETKDKRYVEDA